MSENDCGCTGGYASPSPKPNCENRSSVGDLPDDPCIVDQGSTDCDLPSGACNEAFRRTNALARGFLLMKKAIGDKCLSHLKSPFTGFVMQTKDGDAMVSKQPSVCLPPAQGFQLDNEGVLVEDPRTGKPVLGPIPPFKDLFVSGVKREGEIVEGKEWWSLKAPQSSTPVYLMGERGYWKFGELNENGLQSTRFPDKSVNGRLLVISEDDVCPDPLGRASWCIKEFAPNIGEGQSAFLSLENIGGNIQARTITGAPNSSSFVKIVNGQIELSEDTLDSGLQFVGPDGGFVFANYDGLVRGDKALLQVCIQPDGSATASFVEQSSLFDKILPIGSLLPCFVQTPPEDFLFCNGGSFDPQVFPRLAANLTSLGLPGNIVPDLRGRVIAGLDNIGNIVSADRLSAAALADGGNSNLMGSTFGVDQVSLTEEQNGPHDHEFLSEIDTFAGGRLGGDSDPNGLTQNPDQMRTTEESGDGAPHSNVQPTMVTNIIIKAR